MKCRKNIKRLTPEEKQRYLHAVVQLKNQSLHNSVLMPGMMSRYDDYAMLHMNAMMPPHTWGHGNSNFFPWHREMLYRFEKDLQAIDPSVMIPYWDWTRDRDTGDAGFPFTHPFIGADGTDSASDRVMRESGAPTPYPYLFDPDNWTLIMKENPSDPSFLTRAFAESSNARNLPENDIAVAGSGSSFRQALNAGTYTDLRIQSEDIHNLVHRWVGGTMRDMTSPNDPVFFFHHAQIDRIWSLWQYKHAGTTAYTADATGTPLSSALLFHDPGEIAPWLGSATPNQMINGHTMHGTGVWYDTDLPLIDTPNPSLSFTNIPEGLTSYKAVKFKLQGCRQVHFRITGAPTGRFGLTPMGTEFIATPVESDDFFYGYIWVQCSAAAGAIPNSSVTIRAYIIDDEGYYAAAEGAEYALGDFTVTLTATSVSRERNAIALVLDKSGSMGLPAGGTSTRAQLVQNAIGVFRTLMRNNDEVSVITFDTTVSTPIGMQRVSSAPPFSSIDLTPGSNTWIGGGIEQGALQLAAATLSNRSMIVLTDGNENVHPYIAELPSGTVTNRTYAIGFGLPGEVSDAALQQITANTNGDLIITGSISTTEQRFLLTKYFVQVLAGVTSSDVVLDPDGKLFYGSSDEIEIRLTDADVYADVILLCPIPQYVNFELQTPDGSLLTPTTGEPNVSYLEDGQVACYRMTLPARAGDSEGSHGGTWKALLSLKREDEIKRMLQDERWAATPLHHEVNDFIPYSLIVHTTSNLQFRAWKLQPSLQPGATVQLFAELTAYDVPLSSVAAVWAEMTAPGASAVTIGLKKDKDGRYSTSFATTLAGVYHIRVRAEGYTSSGMPFTREKTMTAGVYYGNYNPLPPPQTGDWLCQMLHCMFTKHHVLNEATMRKLKEAGFDIKRIMKCIEEACQGESAETMPRSGKKEDETHTVQTAAQVQIATLNQPKQLYAPPKQRTFFTLEPPERPTMFEPLNLEEEKKKSETGAPEKDHSPHHPDEHGHAHGEEHAAD